MSQAEEKQRGRACRCQLRFRAAAAARAHKNASVYIHVYLPLSLFLSLSVRLCTMYTYTRKKSSAVNIRRRPPLCGTQRRGVRQRGGRHELRSREEQSRPCPARAGLGSTEAAARATLGGEEQSSASLQLLSAFRSPFHYSFEYTLPFCGLRVVGRGPGRAEQRPSGVTQRSLGRRRGDEPTPTLCLATLQFRPRSISNPFPSPLPPKRTRGVIDITASATSSPRDRNKAVHLRCHWADRWINRSTDRSLE